MPPTPDIRAGRHDVHGEHLAVPASGGVIAASCRVMSPSAACRAGGYACERRFDLESLAPLRERLVEVSGLWVDPLARGCAMFGELGDCIARYLLAEGHDFVITTVPVGIADGGHTAASMHAKAWACACSPDDLRVRPRLGLPMERLCTTLAVRPATQLGGWLRLGAWVCGEPAWSRDAHRAEIPLLLPLARMRSRHARRFVAVAA